LDAFALIFCAAVEVALAVDMQLRDYVAAAAVLCCQLQGRCSAMLSLWLWVLATGVEKHALG
jgi:hypothetical protein